MADPLKAHLASLPEYSSARAQFLYSSLSARKAANPTGYAGALSWWRLTLSSLVSKGLLGGDKLILVADEDLKEHLRWDKIGRPLSLGTVIVRRLFRLSDEAADSSTRLLQAELAQAKEYVPLEAFLASGDAAEGSSWLSLLSRPLWWGVSRVFGSSQGGEGADEAEWNARKGDWVVKELVEVRPAVSLGFVR
jgi:charged multivesicular body protein 7